MSLSIDAFKEASKQKKGPSCTFGVLRGSFDEKDRAVLDEVMADESYTSAGIARKLRELGHNIGEHTVSKHRRGDCLCGRDPS